MKKPLKSQYPTYSQFCTAANDYAKHKSYNGVIKVVATFSDHSRFIDYIERERNQISFPYYDGITVESYYDSNKFVDIVYTDSEPMKLADVKKAIVHWLHNNKDMPTSVSFEIVDYIGA